MNRSNKLKILIVGSGGREHSLAWKLRQSPKVEEIFITPGTAGTSSLAVNLDINKSEEIIEWLKENKVDLVIIGPDDYLASGLSDKINKLGIPVFGPSQVAAEIEWSKSFAKQMMKEEGIPTAKFATFTDLEKAKDYISSHPLPVVIKANGLALGKGVVIAKTTYEADEALNQMMVNKVFGNAGDEIVIEEYLEGREISIHAFCDGENAVLFPTSQDHKRILDDDQGPNTGGMGTIAPVPWTTIELLDEIKDKIVLPCLRGLKKRGRPFKGILYPGLMITPDGPKVIEFNARFGDPEVESYMRILKTDLLDVLFACIDGSLLNQKIEWDSRSACCIVLASGGYPESYKKNLPIVGIQQAENKADVVVFHFATLNVEGVITTNGGRVLAVTAIGNNLSDALQKAYHAVESISFDGMVYRKDIGNKALT